SCVFLSGIAVVVGPWIVRQKAMYGITTLSFNSAEALFAATSPRFATWTPEVTALTRGLTVGEKAAFYNDGTPRHLSRHWRWYIGNAWTHLRETAEGLRPPRGLMAAGCALILASALIGRGVEAGRGALIAVGAMAAALALPDRLLCLPWIAGSIL